MEDFRPDWVALKGSSAGDLLRHYNMMRLPVDVVRLADKLGAPAVWKNMEEDGELYMNMDERRAEIRVKSGASHTRSRFTVAHEIGHLMLHNIENGVLHRDTFNTPRDGMSRWLETQANGYAARLLMPSPLLLPYKKRFGSFDEGLIGALADEFQVSREAMKYRLINLGWHE
tara:strand:+ start:134 stop:649 length:516 start_codon:yes stop_codon:yes gene_type:complete